uniref:Small ribosomal subunit protein uS14m n=1 Tax=Ophioglossum californicum TaxID=1267209 RepID=A0A1B3TRF8_9MONI|nr:ribosomal protein S14 [Ophioglossum californicum]YP_010439838.1 ribosomal protein S14 [Ophioglossum vulgatum]AOH05891.1 ribosomal protein S14 [Ophioglossum californicum]UTD44884.1 ribosomal protein S14 [Ophioglossum vulgatum]
MERFRDLSLKKVLGGSNRKIRDHQRRMLAARYELKRRLYKAIFQDINPPSRIRNKTMSKLSRSPRNSSETRVRNRCIYTGRFRSVYKLFRILRIVFRELASQGSLIGVNKSCW